MLRIALMMLLAAPAFADAPVAQYLFPAGGQRGKTVAFQVGGLNLNQSCSLEMIGPGVQATPIVKRTASPWFEGPLLPLPDSQRQEDYPRPMAGSVAIAADAKLGHRYVLLRTAQGVTSPLRFVVGELPEVAEDEREGRPVAVLVALPVTANGRIYPHEDVDAWSVTLKKGQSLFVQVDANRIGSPLEAKIEVLGPGGRLMADAVGSAGHDPQLFATATDDGVHEVRITDARSDGGPSFVYRLTLTTGPAVESVFPLGGRRGRPLELELTGGGVPARATMRLPGETGKSARVAIPMERGSTPPMTFDLDDLPEVREGEIADPVRGNFLPIPSVGNGRITAAGEVDRWGFTARKGEVVEVELRAARLGSPLIGVLSIADSTGKELMRVEPTDGPDPSLRFVAPADGLFVIAVQDRFARRGGPTFAYRLRVDRPKPDFELSFASLGTAVVRGKSEKLKLAIRRTGGFNGAVSIGFHELPPGLSVPPGLMFAPGQLTLEVPIQADLAAKIEQHSIRVRGTALIPRVPLTTAMTPVVRTATWIDDASIDRARVAIAMATPYKIAGDYELKLIPRGTVYTRRYRIERNGFAGPIEIELADRQARHLQGVTGPKLIVPADKSEFDYPIALPPWMETGRTCRVCVMGTATLKDAAGIEHVVNYSSREQNDQIIAVVEPERLAIRLDRPTVLVEPNTSVELKVTVSRAKGLAGDAKIEVLVPREIAGVSAKPIAVAGEVGTLRLEFGPTARGPFVRPLTIRATVLDGGKPVIAERTIELVRP